MHEFFLTKKDVSVGVFPSVVNNSAQLIFKNSLQEFSKKKKKKHNTTLSARNLQLSFSQGTAPVMKCKVPKSLLFKGRS